MPKSNKIGGKHHKRAKKDRGNNEEEVHMVYAKDSNSDLKQVYAIVKKKLGGKRLEVECSDQKIRQAVIPGKFKKKVWFEAGNIILCNVPSHTNDELCYIIYKYSNNDANKLQQQNLINFDIFTDNKINFTGENNEKSQDLDNSENSSYDSLEESIERYENEDINSEANINSL